MVEKLARIAVWVQSTAACSWSSVHGVPHVFLFSVRVSAGRPAAWETIRDSTSASAEEPLNSKPTPFFSIFQTQQSQLTYTNAQ